MKRVFLLLIVLCSVSPVVGYAQPATNWLTPNPTLSSAEMVTTGVLPETVALAGNIPCVTRTFVTRPAIPLVQTAETASACAVASPLGMIAPAGYTNIFKTDAKVVSSSGGPATFYPVPGTNAVILIENTAQGKKLHYFAQGLAAGRREYNLVTKEMKVFLPSSPDWSLKDAAGKDVFVRSESLAFSANGQWMVVESEFLATLRVDLRSGQVVPFAAPYIYHLGLSVTPHLAISDDGLTAVKTSDRGDFTVTNIGTCKPVPTSITGPVNCTSMSHESFLRSKVGGYYRVYQPRFAANNLLSLYISYTPSSGNRALLHYRLAPSGQSIVTEDYLALGDSFTSGEGAYDYFQETDSKENKCHLSRQSYPYVIGALQGFGRYHSVACSGARIQDITTNVQKPLLPKSNALGNFLPGNKPQLQYVREQSPAIVTVSTGGNDMGFGDKQKQCIMPGTCFTSYEDRLELLREMNAQLPRLIDMLMQLRRDGGPNTRVYIVGYPRVAKPDGRCAANVLLDNDEILLIQQIIDYFNQVVRVAAGRTGTYYVDVSDSFEGYRLCESESRLAAMNGLVFGNDIPLSFGPFGNESFHPNRRGHQLYAAAIRMKSANLQQAMPAPDSSLLLPAESSLALLIAPRSGRMVRDLEYDDQLWPNVIMPGASITVDIDSNRHFLQPGSTVNVELHSQSIALGQFRVDGQGSLQALVTIPLDAPSGFHTVHLFGQNILGSPIDIYQTVYVDGSSPLGANLIGQTIAEQATPQQTNRDQLESDPPSIAEKSLAGQPSVLSRVTIATIQRTAWLVIVLGCLLLLVMWGGLRKK